jgi:hypothetical protein
MARQAARPSAAYLGRGTSRGDRRAYRFQVVNAAVPSSPQVDQRLTTLRKPAWFGQKSPRPQLPKLGVNPPSQ